MVATATSAQQENEPSLEYQPTTQSPSEPSQSAPLQTAAGDEVTADALIEQNELQELPPPSAPLTRPSLNIDAQLRADLDAQFARLQQRLETEEAFSEALGEEYLSYGLLLKRAGRLDEAREMLVDALHLVKVNDGVYAIEQRPILRELFDIYHLKNDTENLQESLAKITWLEARHPDQLDGTTYELLVKAGNHFVDLYLYRPLAGTEGLDFIKAASEYYQSAIERSIDTRLADRLPPYGELALVNVLKSKIKVPYDFAEHSIEYRRRYPDEYMEHRQVQLFLGKSFVTGENFLRQYLLKARAEDNTEHVVLAMLNLGDFNLLFSDPAAAAIWYQLAWAEAAKLPAEHGLIASFSQPVELPAFNYAVKNRVIKRRDERVYVPVTLDVKRSGRVVRVRSEQAPQFDEQMLNRAKRAARRLTFRPAVERGVTIATDNVQHMVRVRVKRS